MDGVGPAGGRQGSDIRELIPGKHKTVRLNDSPVGAITGMVIFAVPGFGFLWFAFRGLFSSLSAHSAGGFIAAVLLGMLGGAVIFPLLLALYVYFDSSRCVSIETLCEHLSITEGALRQAAVDKGILARYDIKGRSVYRPQDFEQLTLLRPSGPTIRADELLRSGSNRSAPAEVLLRSGSAPGARGDDEGSDRRRADP